MAQIEDDDFDELSLVAKCGFCNISTPVFNSGLDVGSTSFLEIEKAKSGKGGKGKKGKVHVHLSCALYSSLVFMRRPAIPLNCISENLLKSLFMRPERDHKLPIELVPVVVQHATNLSKAQSSCRSKVCKHCNEKGASLGCILGKCYREFHPQCIISRKENIFFLRQSLVTNSQYKHEMRPLRFHICNYHSEWNKEWKPLKQYLSENYDNLTKTTDAIDLDNLPIIYRDMICSVTELFRFDPTIKPKRISQNKYKVIATNGNKTYITKEQMYLWQGVNDNLEDPTVLLTNNFPVPEGTKKARTAPSRPSVRLKQQSKSSPTSTSPSAAYPLRSRTSPNNTNSSSSSSKPASSSSDRQHSTARRASESIQIEEDDEEDSDTVVSVSPSTTNESKLQLQHGGLIKTTATTTTTKKRARVTNSTSGKRVRDNGSSNGNDLSSFLSCVDCGGAKCRYCMALPRDRTACCLCTIDKTHLYKEKLKYSAGWIHSICKRTHNKSIPNEKCIVCELPGAVVKCSFKNCTKTFHMSCAWTHKFEFNLERVNTTTTAGSHSLKIRATCAEHSGNRENITSSQAAASASASAGSNYHNNNNNNNGIASPRSSMTTSTATATASSNNITTLPRTSSSTAPSNIPCKLIESIRDSTICLKPKGTTTTAAATVNATNEKPSNGSLSVSSSSTSMSMSMSGSGLAGRFKSKESDTISLPSSSSSSLTLSSTNSQYYQPQQSSSNRISPRSSSSEDYLPSATSASNLDHSSSSLSKVSSISPNVLDDFNITKKISKKVKADDDAVSQGGRGRGRPSDGDMGGRGRGRERERDSTFIAQTSSRQYNNYNNNNNTSDNYNNSSGNVSSSRYGPAAAPSTFLEDIPTAPHPHPTSLNVTGQGTGTGRGMGRGRGQTLPAWITTQQSSANARDAGDVYNDDDSNSHVFDDAYVPLNSNDVAYNSNNNNIQSSTMSYHPTATTLPGPSQEESSNRMYHRLPDQEEHVSSAIAVYGTENYVDEVLKTKEGHIKWSHMYEEDYNDMGYNMIDGMYAENIGITCAVFVINPIVSTPDPDPVTTAFYKELQVKFAFRAPLQPEWKYFFLFHKSKPLGQSFLSFMKSKTGVLSKDIQNGNYFLVACKEVRRPQLPLPLSTSTSTYPLPIVINNRVPPPNSDPQYQSQISNTQGSKVNLNQNMPVRQDRQKDGGTDHNLPPPNRNLGSNTVSSRDSPRNNNSSYGNGNQWASTRTDAAVSSEAVAPPGWGSNNAWDTTSRSEWERPKEPPGSKSFLWKDVNNRDGEKGSMDKESNRDSTKDRGSSGGRDRDSSWDRMKDRGSSGGRDRDSSWDRTKDRGSSGGRDRDSNRDSTKDRGSSGGRDRDSSWDRNKRRDSVSASSRGDEGWGSRAGTSPKDSQPSKRDNKASSGSGETRTGDAAVSTGAPGWSNGSSWTGVSSSEWEVPKGVPAAGSKSYLWKENNNRDGSKGQSSSEDGRVRSSTESMSSSGAGNNCGVSDKSSAKTTQRLTDASIVNKGNSRLDVSTESTSSGWGSSNSWGNTSNSEFGASKELSGKKSSVVKEEPRDETQSRGLSDTGCSTTVAREVGMGKESDRGVVKNRTAVSRVMESDRDRDRRVESRISGVSDDGTRTDAAVSSEAVAPPGWGSNNAWVTTSRSEWERPKDPLGSKSFLWKDVNNRDGEKGQRSNENKVSSEKDKEGRCSIQNSVASSSVKMSSDSIAVSRHRDNNIYTTPDAINDDTTTTTTTAISATCNGSPESGLINEITRFIQSSDVEKHFMGLDVKTLRQLQRHCESMKLFCHTENDVLIVIKIPSKEEEEAEVEEEGEDGELCDSSIDMDDEDDEADAVMDVDDDNVDIIDGVLEAAMDADYQWLWKTLLDQMLLPDLLSIHSLHHPISLDVTKECIIQVEKFTDSEILEKENTTSMKDNDDNEDVATVEKVFKNEVNINESNSCDLNATDENLEFDSRESNSCELNVIDEILEGCHND
eukprot:gene3203-6324_t